MFLRRGRANPLPPGTVAVGVGLVVAGLSSYGFLVLTARSLGPQRYASLSALWALVFLIGPGFFFPLEQELSRGLASRAAHSKGGRPLLKRGIQAAALAVGALAAATSLAAPTLASKLFSGDSSLVVAFAVAMGGYAALHVGRGVFSGTAQFKAYSMAFGAEGAIRLVAAAALIGLGIESAGNFGLVLALSPFAATLISARMCPRLTDGPEAPMRELSRALGYLFMASLFAQFLINAGPLAVKILAGPEEEAIAGRFLAALIVARVPLFLYQAVQAALLPKLAGLAAEARHKELNAGLLRLLGAISVLGVVMVLLWYLAGDWVVGFLFGDSFVLGRSHLLLLSVGSVLYILAQTLSQGLLAFSAHKSVAAGWLAGSVAFLLPMFLLEGVLRRVELSFVAGCGVSALAMGLLLLARQGSEEPTEYLTDTTTEIILEP